MRSVRHVTPRYLLARAQLAAAQIASPRAPWLTRQATRLLDELLRADDVAFEWGAGRSTPWLARRVARLTSVEHEARWHARVRDWLAADGIENVVLRLVESAERAGADETDPYVAAVAEQDEQSLGLVLVDGILRDLCARAALPRLAPGGLLVIDNANWYFGSPSRAPDSLPPGAEPPTAAWREVADAVAGWRRIWTTNGVWDTAIWIKPGRR